MSEKIEILGPPIELSALRSNIFAESWIRSVVGWDEWYGRLKVYKEREGNCRVPDECQQNGFRLGQWVGVQRRSKDVMSGERRERLDELGFVWDAREADWLEGFNYLKIYRGRNGDCRVPVDYNENGFGIGRWVDRQRQTKETMPAERRRQLDELGFVWDPLEANWEEGFRYLKRYQEREGNCRAPNNRKENEFRLGQWMGVQR